MNKTHKTVAALGSALALSVAANVSAAENPFALKTLSAGYQVADHHEGKEKQGKCGNGKCSAEMKDKAAEGKCSAEKKADGKCGAGKCGAEMKDKAAEGKCSAEKAK